MINFNNFDHNFCESTIYSNEQHPEYFNSISSLFITFIGINAIMKPNINFLLSMLYSSLIVNGITSCFYHYYNTIGWGLLDRMSMLLIAISSVNLFTNNITSIIKLDRWTNINTINRIIHILVTSYFTILFTIAGLHMESLFNIMFGLFLGSLFIFMFLINKHRVNLNIPLKIVYLGWKGIMYIMISGLFWIITENLCTEYNFIKYLFGHVWWHIFVSYGGYLISLIPCYIYLLERQLKNMVIIEINYDSFNIPYLGLKSISQHIHYNMV
jgi:hypothetical protein